jgi:hypothetical protein
MDQSHYFHPPRRTGSIIQIGMIILFSAAGLWGIWQINQARAGIQILPFIFAVLISLVTVPFLVYRYYSLQQSLYTLRREGITLQWGWRSETIPMADVEWVHPAHDLETPLRFPRLRWPGSLVGARIFSRGPSIEFMASTTQDLIIIALKNNRYFVISPRDVNHFLETFRELTEMGALESIESQSVQSRLLLTNIWKERPALILIVLGFLLNITLLTWALLIIPNRSQISLGFTPRGTPHEPLDSVRLLLLPILNAFAYFINLFLGFFLFRRAANRLLSYFLWGTSLAIAVFFHIGVYFITR